MDSVKLWDVGCIDLLVIEEVETFIVQGEEHDLFQLQEPNKKVDQE